jgi:hypothetical protein
MTTQRSTPKVEPSQEEYREFLLIIVFFLLGEEETSLSTSLG